MKTQLVKLFFCLLMVSCNAQNKCEEELLHNGNATYYYFNPATQVGSCSFKKSQITPFLVGAINDEEYGKADYCGACVEIEGPKGSVKVQIVDRCPACKSGDIDLNAPAFDSIASRAQGRVAISWKVVPCEVTNPLTFHFIKTSNEWWASVQIRNHRNPLAKLEFLNDSVYKEMPRKTHNYFTMKNMGVGPHTYRLTDVYGNEIIEENVPFAMTESMQQFPVCGSEEEVPKEIVEGIISE